MDGGRGDSGFSLPGLWLVLISRASRFGGRVAVLRAAVQVSRERSCGGDFVRVLCLLLGLWKFGDGTQEPLCDVALSS